MSSGDYQAFLSSSLDRIGLSSLLLVELSKGRPDPEVAKSVFDEMGLLRDNLHAQVDPPVALLSSMVPSYGSFVVCGEHLHKLSNELRRAQVSLKQNFKI